MKIIIRAVLFAFLCCLLLVLANPVVAMSDADKAVWGASEKVDTSFIVPSAQGATIMGKAQGLISQWGSYDGGMTAMKIETMNDNLIVTYNPTGIGNVGFSVTRTTLPQGDEISVSTMYYTGNIFSMGRDRKDADKRAHLLSYVLQVYAKNLSTALPVPSAPIATATTANAVTLPELPSDFEAYLKIIRLQLSEQKYQLALASLEGLKSAIVDKQKSAAGQSAPTLTVSTPSDVKPAGTPDTTVKPTPAP